MLAFFSVFIPSFLAGIVQVSFFPLIFPPGYSPDLALAMAVFWSLRSGYEFVWLRVVVLGLIFGFFFPAPPGFYILPFSLAGFLTDSLAKRFLVSSKKWNLGLILFLVFLTTLAFDGTFFLGEKLPVLGNFSGGTGRGGLFFLEISFWFRVVANTFLLFAFKLVFSKLEKIFFIQEKSYNF